MDTLNHKQLINLSVYSESGLLIGKIVGFEVDVESYVITNFHVRSKQIVQGLFEGVLVVGNHQVLEITQDKMVVEDTLITKTKKAGSTSAA